MNAFTEKSRDELIRESRLLYKNLQKEMKRISRTPKPLLKDAYNRFQDFKQDFKLRELNKYDTRKLKNVYRDLKNISQLKTATKEGAMEALETYGKTRDLIESLSEEKQQQFWETYSKAYKNLIPSMVDKYKYEIFSAISSEMLQGQDVDDIYEKLEKSFNRAYTSNESEEKQGAKFVEELRILSSELFDDIFDEYS